MQSFEKKAFKILLNSQFSFHVFYLKSSGENKNQSLQFSKTVCFDFIFVVRILFNFWFIFSFLFYIRIVLINLEGSVVKILICCSSPSNIFQKGKTALPYDLSGRGVVVLLFHSIFSAV